MSEAGVTISLGVFPSAVVVFVAVDANVVVLVAVIEGGEGGGGDGGGEV